MDMQTLWIILFIFGYFVFLKTIEFLWEYDDRKHDYELTQSGYINYPSGSCFGGYVLKCKKCGKTKSDIFFI